MLIDALEKLESFRLGDVGYMSFYRVIPHTYGNGLPADIGYFSEEWSALYPPPLDGPVPVDATPLFLLDKWYSYPLQRKVLIKPDFAPAVKMSEDSLPGMIETYDDGFRIYADMDFFQYYESTRERVSNDYWLGEQSGVIVYVEIAFRGINATGIRRGQKIIVAREIMLKGEV